MSERTSYEPGTFSWAELATNDAEGAKQFYGSLHGWEFDERPIPDGGAYVMAIKDGLEVAALFTASDQPPHWNNYVTVASADDAAAKAQELGGTVVMRAFDVMDAGRMAVVQDPTGAMLSVWEPRASIGARRMNEPGAMTWNDLVTPDIERAARFYGDWMGWKTEAIPEAGGYCVIWNGERTNGGMQPLRPEMGPNVPPHWNPYFGVEDLDRARAQVDELGGRVLAGPYDVPNGAFIVIMDPQGAASSLWAGTYDD